MSCRQRARGTYTIPASEIVALRKKLVGWYNEQLRAAYERRRDWVRELRSGTHKTLEAYKARVDALQTPEPGMFFDPAEVFTEQAAAVEFRRDVAWGDGIPRVKKSALKSPKASDYKAIPLSRGHVTLKGWRLDEFAPFDITIDTAKRTVRLDFGEGNKVFTDAEEGRMLGVVTRALAEVQWKRGSGGYVQYTDEYMEEGATCDFPMVPQKRCIFPKPTGDRLTATTTYQF